MQDNLIKMKKQESYGGQGGVSGTGVPGFGKLWAFRKIYFDFTEGLCYNESSACVIKTRYRMSGYYLLNLEGEYL